MAKINPSFYRILIALIIGLVLVLFPQDAADYLVIAVGVIFMLPSVFSMVNHFMSKTEPRPPFPIDALGGFLFGLMLVIMPGFFGNILDPKRRSGLRNFNICQHKHSSNHYFLYSNTLFVFWQ